MIIKIADCPKETISITYDLPTSEKRALDILAEIKSTLPSGTWLVSIECKITVTVAKDILVAYGESLK